jgi:hypothetical protein
MAEPDTVLQYSQRLLFCWFLSPEKFSSVDPFCYISSFLDHYLRYLVRQRRGNMALCMHYLLRNLSSFRLETALFRNLCVNQRI